MKRLVFDRDRLGPWLCEKTNGEWYGQGQTIGLEEDGRVIACAMYERCNGSSVVTHIAGEPGKRWMTREFLRVIFDYPFNQLGVSKLIGFVDGDNTDAMRFDLHLGFVPEAVIHGAGTDGCDLNVLTMTRNQCRFLKDSDVLPASASAYVGNH